MSQSGYDLIKKFESLILTAYPDPINKDGLPITVGYGSCNGSLPPGESFKLGDTIDEATAIRWMEYEVEHHINPEINRLVNFELEENELGALQSFCYNLGTGALQRSTMLKLINNDQFEDAQAEFLKFCISNGEPVRGLLRRRLAEAALFGPLSREELIAKYLDGYDPELG